MCILVLAYLIVGKDVKGLMKAMRGVDWKGRARLLVESLQQFALKVGRTAARPLLQFYYVMDDDRTTVLDKVLIYGAIAYTVSPVSLIPAAVYKVLGVLDEGVAVLFVYNRVKKLITPQVNVKVEHTLNKWFGLEYEKID